MPNNIKTIAPLLASQFIDVEDDIELVRNRDKFTSYQKTLLGGFHNYLDKLHDSWIVNTKVNSETYSITLNDFTTHVFADALIENKGLNFNDDDLVFPIRFDFNIIDITYNTVDDDGNIYPIEITIIDEYLDEQIIEITEEKIKVGLVVWKKGKPGKPILILISVTSIVINDERDKAWAMIFAHNYDDHYNYFKSQLEKGIFLSDVTKCKELISKFESDILN